MLQIPEVRRYMEDSEDSLFSLHAYPAIPEYFLFNSFEERRDIRSFENDLLAVFIIPLRKELLVEIEFYIGVF